jgi:hypothetical protein
MSRKIAIVLGALLSLIAACSNNSLAPFQPEIANTQNNFQLQATKISNVSTTLTYNWQNTGTTANVNQSCSITSGGASVTISDANGAQVYSHDLSANGTFTTATGATGTWVIRVTLSSMSGTLNFRVQKP